MKTPLAIHNLWHQRVKTVVSVGGVAFALLLVFMQLGFMGAVSYTATNIIDKLDFDIMIRARDYTHFYEASTIDRRWIDIAKNTQGVDRADPLWVMIQNWRRLPTQNETQDLGTFWREREQFLPIAVMAFEPHTELFDIEQVKQERWQLQASHILLLDDSTQQDYGPWNGVGFSQEDIERSQDPAQPHRLPEIQGEEYEMGGLFKLGTGLAANAAAIMGDRAFSRISPWDVNKTANFGLVRLHPSYKEDPVLVQQVVDELRSRVGTEPADIERLRNETGFWTEVRQLSGLLTGVQKTGEVDVMTKEEAKHREKYRWLQETPIGMIFQMGVLLSLVVGAVIVYMVLSTDVANRLPEYATLLAMGYSRKYLATMVMTQAMVLCALGFVSAWVAAEILYRVTTYISKIPLIMDPVTVILVGILGVVMCNVSGLLAMRKLWKAEPASLF